MVFRLLLPALVGKVVDLPAFRFQRPLYSPGGSGITCVPKEPGVKPIPNDCVPSPAPAANTPRHPLAAEHPAFSLPPNIDPRDTHRNVA